MPERIAIIAALPREIAALVRGIAADAALRRRGIYLYRLDNAVVVAAGMGAERAAVAVEAALAAASVTALLSVGVAGACDPSLGVGTIVRAGSLIDAQTGERFENLQFRQVLVTATSIASVKEKQRLHATYNASAVDMEAATVARIAQAHGIYFQAIKSISDEADFELKELGQFVTADGQFREAAFAVYALFRPWVWKKLLVLARNSKQALVSLTTALEGELRWYRERG